MKYEFEIIKSLVEEGHCVSKGNNAYVRKVKMHTEKPIFEGSVNGMPTTFNSVESAVWAYLKAISEEKSKEIS